MGKLGVFKVFEKHWEQIQSEFHVNKFNFQLQIIAKFQINGGHNF